MKRVRLLIIDDSITVRRLLTEIFGRDPEIEVIGAAPDPLVARQMIKDLNPDVITLDVEMPNMNGLDFLEKIMRLRPMPVVMVSTLTKRGTEVTLDALALGAVDYFAKPAGNLASLLNDGAEGLCRKVKSAAAARVRPGPPKPAQTPAPQQEFQKKLIAIGSSTGGVEALIDVIAHFPANCPPTLITQHMPAGFTTSFASRLDRISAAKVTEAVEGAPLSPGHIYLAPGAVSHLEVTGRGTWRCALVPDAPTSGHRPSVDRLFYSVARTVGADAIGAILTGMGSDGAAGLRAMRDAGAATIGQDEGTSVVYGMPRVAFQQGAVQRQLPLEKIGPQILRIASSEAKETA
ncbi:MAG TPA: chemotaxis response regulator protein-glutamate methylesterase [Rhizomicrobium sp.]|jgi:two-component system chemotaxis response regulator CheB|nr:chemotaxis response regulator protein-glutamate methylesterase [Rhizomicrobium sp.]